MGMKVNRQYYDPEKDGFYGAFYECPSRSDKAMSPDKKDYGHHNYPLERFGKAIEVLQEKGCSKIGIVGASTTGMLSLLAASYRRRGRCPVGYVQIYTAHGEAASREISQLQVQSAPL